MRWAVGIRLIIIALFTFFGLPSSAQSDTAISKLTLLISGEPHLKSRLRKHQIENAFPEPDYSFTSLKFLKEFSFGFGIHLPLNQWLNFKKIIPIVSYHIDPLLGSRVSIINNTSQERITLLTSGFANYVSGNLTILPFGHKTLTIGINLSAGWHQTRLKMVDFYDTLLYRSNQFGYSLGLSFIYRSQDKLVSSRKLLYFPISIGIKGTNKINYAYIEACFPVGFGRRK